METGWIGLIMVALAAYLAFRLIGVVMRLLLCAALLVGGYWLLAPLLGWPGLSELAHGLGPDAGGERMEDVISPGRVMDLVGNRVATDVMQRLDTGLQDAFLRPMQGQPLPQPVPDLAPLHEGALPPFTAEPPPPVEDQGPAP